MAQYLFWVKTQVVHVVYNGSSAQAGSEARPGRMRRRPAAGSVNRTEHRSSSSRADSDMRRNILGWLSRLGCEHPAQYLLVILHV